MSIISPTSRSQNFKGGGISGVFPSLKMRLGLPFDSSIEKDLMYVLDFSPWVKRFSVQPFMINGIYNDRYCSYYPDVYANCSFGNLLLEAKPAAWVEEGRPEVLQQIALGSDWCDQRGDTFSLVTDTMLRNGPRLGHIKKLWRDGRRTGDISVIEKARRFLGLNQHITFIELATYLAAPQPAMTVAPAIRWMIFHHVVWADLDQPDLNYSRVWTNPFWRSDN